MQAGKLLQQFLHGQDRVFSFQGIAVVNVPGDKMQWDSIGAAVLQQGSQNGALPVSERRTTHFGSRVCPQNSFGCALVESRIVLGRESARTSTIFANVGLVGDFPVWDSFWVFLKVPDRLVNQLFPFGIVVGLDNILIDRWEESLWLDGNAHQGLSACSKNRLYGSIECFPVVRSFSRIDIKILLDKQTNQTGMQTADLGNSILPHGNVGETPLTQTKSVYFHGTQVLLDIDGDARGAALWE